MIMEGLIHHKMIGKYVIHSLASAVSQCLVFLINRFVSYIFNLPLV